MILYVLVYAEMLQSRKEMPPVLTLKKTITSRSEPKNGVGIFWTIKKV